MNGGGSPAGVAESTAAFRQASKFFLVGDGLSIVGTTYVLTALVRRRKSLLRRLWNWLLFVHFFCSWLNGVVTFVVAAYTISPNED